ncbi:formimidoylglutamate deiminase [Dactylosporangium vinaceum]|uniref:Formimidoylglutamate deiminase n=1 Tax=Dactylosporangium vinaceum TaxID=53362 RepID=A0ABV5MPL8_9ACTN|nr:formimidoylglutamate deiminase [Dactylosporangium vinaceum]
MTRYHCAHAWLPTGVAADVLVEIAGGRFVAVRPDTPLDAPEAAGAVRLAGLTLPGLANAHSHAFHRALRGRTQRGRGTFWTWREQMYAVAGALDPDSYHALAVAVYSEMALAGITCVGEFHYLHHAPGGAAYTDPNAMGEALIAAAADAGIRITLLDTLYLTAGVDGRALEGVQLRFGDGSFDAWSTRLDRLRPRPHARIGAAAHSVRAVPVDALTAFAARTDGLPTHVHLSEQRAENEACLAIHGRTPTELLADRGLLGGRVTAVHATHLSDTDRAELGDSGTGVCCCPTTERDLADGIGPARALADAGSPLSLGSDSHAVIDLFEEARGVEMHERLHTERRGHFTGAELIGAATAAGHAALGWPHAGTIAVGGRADLVTVALDSPRTAGCDPAAIGFAATAADVRHVLVDGRAVVRDGVHTAVPDVGAALREALATVAADARAVPVAPSEADGRRRIGAAR